MVDELDIVMMTTPVVLAGLFFIIVLKIGRLGVLKQPIDFGFKVWSKPLFGKNKTFAGFVIMGLFTMFFGLAIYSVLHNYFDYELDIPTIRLSVYFLLVGLAYSFGELPNSFVKRQLDIAPGEVAEKKIFKYIFFVIDNIDSVLACWLVYVWLFDFSVESTLVAVVVSAVIHLGTDVLMRGLKLK